MQGFSVSDQQYTLGDQEWQNGPGDSSSCKSQLLALVNWLLHSFFLSLVLSLGVWLFGCLSILFSVKYELRLKNQLSIEYVLYRRACSTREKNLG